MSTTTEVGGGRGSLITRVRQARPCPLRDPDLKTLTGDDAFGSNVAPRELDDVESGRAVVDTPRAA